MNSFPPKRLCDYLSRVIFWGVFVFLLHVGFRFHLFFSRSLCANVILIFRRGGDLFRVLWSAALMGVKPLPPPSPFFFLFPPLEKFFRGPLVNVILAPVLQLLVETPVDAAPRPRGGGAIDTLLTNTTDASLCDGVGETLPPPLSLCHVRKFITKRKI